MAIPQIIKCLFGRHRFTKLIVNGNSAILGHTTGLTFNHCRTCRTCGKIETVRIKVANWNESAERYRAEYIAELGRLNASRKL